jgi:WD40 repeat protein
MTPDGRFVLAGLVENDTERHTAIDLLTGQQWFFDARRGDEPMFFPSGRAFLTRDLDRLTRWDLLATNPDRPTRLTLRAQVELDPDGPKVESMAVAPDGRHCVLVHDWARHSEKAFTLLDGITLRTIRTWAVAVDSDAVRERANIRHWITERTGSRTAVAVRPDGRTVAVASLHAPLIRFFNLETGTEIVHHGGHGERVGHLMYRPDFLELASGSADKVARTWNVETLRPTHANWLGAIREADVQPNFDLRELQLQTGRRKLVYESGRIQLRDVDTEKLVSELPEAFDESSDDLGGEPPTAVSADDWWCAYRAGDRVVVHDQESGLKVATFRVEGSWPTALEFIPGTDLIVVGYHDGPILIWRVRPPGTPDRPTAADLEMAWADLAGDAADAVRGRATFLTRPADSIAWLKDRLRPIPHPTEYDIDLWLARLAHRRFAVREEATRLLARHFDVAEGPIREVLAVTKSPEIEHRLRGLLASQTHGADAESVRLNRLVVILERIGTADARELLFRSARGAGVPAVRATDALERLRAGRDTVP